MERREEELSREINDLKKIINGCEGNDIFPKSIMSPVTN